MNNIYLANYNSTNLRKCQLKQLDILKNIDALCKSHSIQYWLDSGSLLGAVRHGGFIPWDDDTDIVMPKDDYERFVAIAKKELPSWLHIQIPEEENAKEPITKVRDLNSLFIEPEDDFSSPYEKGLYVDIFPFIPYPKINIEFSLRTTKELARCYSILHKKHYYSLRAFAELVWFGLKFIFLRSMWFIVCALFPKSEYWSNTYLNKGYGGLHKGETIFPIKKIKFEGEYFPCPNNPDQYLKDLYGDYMKMPSEDQRKPHSCFYVPELTNERL